MSQTPNNIDPKEATEARLCAYLEGELDPAERAEIEKYLETNPQHRQLLSELATTRKWLSAVPHESAPAEIAEAFEGQLERSMLLDGSGATETAAAISHWPKFLLAAAMVLLAAGLGTVVYFTLPGAPPPKYSVGPSPATGPTSPSPIVAVAPPSAGETMMSKGGPSVSPTTESMAKTGGDEVAKSSAGLTASQPIVQSDQANVAATNAPPVTAAGPTIADKEALQDNAVSSLNLQNQSATVVTNRDEDASALRDRLLRSGPPGSDAANTLYVLVSSENPAAASHTVENYFASNGILYDSHAANQAVAMDKDKGSFDLKQAPEQANGPAPLGMPTTEPVASARLAPAAKLYKAFSGANGNTNSAGQNLSAYNNNGTVNNDSVNGQAAHGQPQIQAQNAEQLPAQQQLAQVGNAPASAADELVYVARGLTPDQAERLRIALTTPVPGQHAQVIGGAPAFRADVSAGPATMPATNPADVITTDDRLRVTVAQLVGPGVEKTNTVRVADDGTISLPMIEPVKAAGLTPVEVEKQIATKYRDANLINDATVNVDRVMAETQPTTVPADVATTQPTTEPSIAQVKPAAEKVDVVVLIAQSPAATQPVMGK